MGFLEGNSEVLDRLVMEMYARGLSTRDVEDAFRDATGEMVISKSAVSEVTDELWTQYEAFCARDLSDIDVENALTPHQWSDLWPPVRSPSHQHHQDVSVVS